MKQNAPQNLKREVVLALKLFEASFLTFGAFYTALILRTNNVLFPDFKNFSSEQHFWTFGIGLFLNYLFISSTIEKGKPIIQKVRLSFISKKFLIELLVFSLIIFLFQFKATSRYFLLIYLFTNGLGLWLTRPLINKILGSLAKKTKTKILIIGEPEKGLKAIIQRLRMNQSHEGQIIGFVSLDSSLDKQDHPHFLGLDVLGSISDLEEIVRTTSFEKAYFCQDKIDLDTFSQIESKLFQSGRSLSLLIPNKLFSPNSYVIKNNFGVFELERSQSQASHSLLKKSLDLILSGLGVFILIGTIPLVWSINLFLNRGPLFFYQKRVGLNGRIFKLWKYRTMVVDAEAQKEKLRGKDEARGPLFKISDDPRITPFGKFLRRTSLDELPQFLNVVKGEMSVIGPRPPTMSETKHYRFESLVRLSVPPGITGLAQINSQTHQYNFHKVVKYDRLYIRKWSFGLDLLIAIKTIWHMISMRNRG
jgi:exopolysaccharide biosynthesis polyprenyl glycosylphosphotransferase